MERMTWTEALFIKNGGLKGYRDRNNIILSEEYMEATGRYMLAAMFWMSLTSFIAGLMLGAY